MAIDETTPRRPVRPPRHGDEPLASPETAPPKPTGATAHRVREACPADFGMGPLFGRIREAVVVADAERGTIVVWNPAAEALFGYTAAEAVGQPLDLLIPEPLRARHRVGLAGYAATGHGVSIDASAPLELPALRKDGAGLTVELTLSVIEPTNESPLHGRFVLALIRDVTARHRAQYVALSRQAALLEAQYEASPDAILMVSPAGEIVSCNRRFRALWPLPLPDDASAARCGHTATQAMLTSVADPASFLEQIDYLYGHPSEESHDEFRLLDGRTFDRHSTPVTAPDGEHYGRVWYLRDITDRTRLEATLQASEERYSLLVELSPDLVAVHADGVIRYMNAAGLAVVGASTAAEPVGRPIRDFIHPSSLAKVLERARQGQEERWGHR